MKPNSKSAPAKKTIYLDPEDEITVVIDKVLSSAESVVALVVPRRATVFQSIVNMKLLKRSADQNDKKIVLVTSNNSILPLAGTVGIHAASSLSSQPYLPSKPKAPETANNINDPEPLEIDTLAPDDDQPIDPKEVDITDEEAPLEVDNAPKVAEKPSKKSKSAKKSKYGSPLKVPNFEKFRLGLVLAVVGVLALAVLLFWAIKIAPKAVVSISGEGTSKNLAFGAEIDTAVKEVDTGNKVLPAVQKQISRAESEKVPATGQKDKGQKASGSATLSLNDCSQSQVTVPSGTAISAGGLSFITQVDVTLQSVRIGPTCRNSDFPQVSTAKVKVVAQSPGENYNVNSQNYTVLGFSNVSAKGTDMNGGTSQIVKVVTASDINNAKKKITDKQNAVSGELSNSLTAVGSMPLKDTFNISNGDFSSSPDVDSEADQVTVTVNATYTMLGVDKNDLSKLIKAQAYASGIDEAKQTITDDGLSQAVIVVGDKDETSAKLSITTNVYAGPQLDQNTLKDAIKGKKSGNAEQILKSRPGIKSVSVKTSPFWVNSVPSDSKKIHMTIQGGGNSNATQKP